MPMLDLRSAHIDPAKSLDTGLSVGIAKLKGVTDKVVLSSIADHDVLVRDYLYTWSVMCAPDDGAATFARLDAAMSAADLQAVLRSDRNIAAKGMVSGEVALAIKDMEDWRALLEDIINKSKLAHVASGFILRWAVSRWERSETKAEASLERAMSVVEEWYRTNRFSGGGRQNLKQHVWPRFRCVARRRKVLSSTARIFSILGTGSSAMLSLLAARDRPAVR